MLKKILLILLFVSFCQAGFAAPLKVVATSTSLGALVNEITSGEARLTVLAPPDRDMHYLQAKPSMIRAVRGADLVVAIGAELEIGWLPMAISSASNPKINPGQRGYFEAAAQVKLMDIGGPADRALGDVHPAGNPHINTDPVRMAEVAHALALRLGELDAENARHYQARAEAFAQKVQQRLPGWKTKVANAPGALLYHKDINYLLDRLEVPLLGYIEPVPGVPPTASHLKQLVSDFKGRQGVILTTTYQSPQAPKSLAKTLGWSHNKLPLDPPLKSDGEGYLAHIDDWVNAIAGSDP